jgi:hypothetical protein
MTIPVSRLSERPVSAEALSSLALRGGRRVLLESGRASAVSTSSSTARVLLPLRDGRDIGSRCRFRHDAVDLQMSITNGGVAASSRARNLTKAGPLSA